MSKGDQVSHARDLAPLDRGSALPEILRDLIGGLRVIQALRVILDPLDRGKDVLASR